MPGRGPAPDHAGRGADHRGHRGAAHRRHPRRGPDRPRLPRLGARPAPGHRRAPRRACCPSSRRSSRSCSPRAWSGRSSPPRPSPSASTCPRRTVVLEKLDKWNGEAHVALTPGEYTQLTGRAGRRGIDVEGHAVVLWQPGLDPGAVAGLAGTRTYPLNSSFRPSYNMAVNLTGQVGRARAAALLESSFAQFQADRGVVGLARRLRRLKEQAADLARQVSCDRGDFMEYAAMRRRLTEAERGASRSRASAQRAEARRVLATLRRGDIIRVPSGRRAGLAVVLNPPPAGGEFSPNRADGPLVLTVARPAQAAVRGRLPGAGRARRPAPHPELVQRALAEAPPRPGLRDAQPRSRAATADPSPRRRRSAAGAGDEESRTSAWLRRSRTISPDADQPGRRRGRRDGAGPRRGAPRRGHRRAAPQAPPSSVPRVPGPRAARQVRRALLPRRRRKPTSSSARSRGAST